jgi:hypothetical protein
MQSTQNEFDPETIEVVLKPRGAGATGYNTFTETIKELGELEQLVGKASKAMGVSSEAEFSKDILTINVRRHKQTPLALVDLPGIIHSEGAGQGVTGANKQLVDDIVEEWIKLPHSIILAVVDATRDPASHNIFERAHRWDPDGNRTIGIITKPDVPEANEESQQNWVGVALNQNSRYRFSKGWHVLRNRGESELRNATSSDIRDGNEKKYFEDPKSGWKAVVDESKRSPKTCGYGVEHLKIRLKVLLEKQTRQMIPKIQDEINQQIMRLEEKLQQLGIGGLTPEEGRKQFVKLCEKMGDLAMKGLSGWHDRDFHLDDINRADLDAGHLQFVRSNIKDQDEVFAHKLRNDAHDNFFVWDHFDTASDPENWEDRVHKILGKTQGTEIQTQVDPARINLIFHSYSKGWKKISEMHIRSVSTVCQRFLDWVVDQKLGAGFAGLGAAVKQYVRPVMRDRFRKAIAELDKLEDDRLRPVRTVNMLFEEQSQAVRHREAWRLVHQAMASQDVKLLQPRLWLGQKHLAQAVGIETSSDTKKRRAAEFIMDTLIYYRVR